MGIGASKEDEQKLKRKTSAELMDYLASNYITTASFKSLKKMNEKEYCDKMVVLTTDLLNKYFDSVDIRYLAERIKNGDGDSDSSDKKEMADKAFFIEKDKLHDRIDSTAGKLEVCREIAKFYITIAHIFAAIMTTMNPMVEYTDPATGQVNQVSVLEKKERVPDNVAYEIIHKTSLCDRRIKSLKRGHGKVSEDPNQETINVHPQVCDINKNVQTGETMRLTDEPGIPEFMRLYFDKYNPETGEFDDMTDKTRDIFKEDLKIFYEVFTGETEMPNYVSKFSDIKLRDYNAQPKCQGVNPPLNQHVRGTVSQKLFKQYAENLTEMIANANKNQEALMDILTEIFGYTVDAQGKKTVRINSALTEEALQKLVVRCRELIIKLILQCEVDFTNGVRIYEAIIESKVFDTVQNQIKNIDEQILGADVPVPVSASKSISIPETKPEIIEDVAVPVSISEPVPKPQIMEEVRLPVPVPVPEVPVQEVPVSVPEVPVQEVPVPEMSEPEVPVLEVPVPEVPVQEVPEPEVPVPEVPVPEVPVPEMSEPEVPLQEVPVQEVPEPEVSVQEVPVPEVPEPIPPTTTTDTNETKEEEKKSFVNIPSPNK